MMGEGLVDKYGRKHEYLRISVTDRCNLRCTYCMSPEGIPCIDHNQILSYEQIIRVVEAAAELGITKIRLTGGEPLVRKDIEKLISGIAAIPGIKDIAMTTNGILLAGKAQQLKRAGLNRVNISLDSLLPDVYRKITRLGELQDALDGIQAALKYGMDPIKINIVLMNGVNDKEIDSFLRLALEQPFHLRFIEYMPIDSHDSEWRKKYLPLQIVLNRAAEMGFPMEPVKKKNWFGPAEMYSMPGARGLVGLIHPISKHFCGECNRLRLTAEGYIKPCLYWTDELSIRSVLNDRDGIKVILKQALGYKKKEHNMNEHFLEHDRYGRNQRGMSMIGG